MLASHYYEGLVEAGCDEAGRGCLAGSVYAAAVILPPDYQNELLNDSKQLTEHRRYQLRDVIQHDAVAWAVGVVTPEEIDHINILNASILAMHRALDQLTVRPEAIIVDGNRFKPYYEPSTLHAQPSTLTGISRLMLCSSEMRVSVATTPGMSCSFPLSSSMSCSLSRA